MNDSLRDSHYRYNKDLRAFARALRNNGTKAEACLWKYVLRAGMAKGYSFNRQRPIMNYVADFFCKKLRLVIEVDGATHLDDKTRLKDAKKQSDLERAGFKVVRFADEEVLNDIEAVKASLEKHIEEREKELGLLTSPIPPH